MLTFRFLRPNVPSKPVAHRRLVARVMVVGAGLLVATGTAVGSASACVSTTVLPSTEVAGAISAAVYASPLTGALAPDAFDVADPRLARSDPEWGVVDIRPRTDVTDPAIGVVQHTPAGWQLVQLGTYEVGCGLAPAEVLADLELSCPPTAVGE